jgi:hypothetical protein
MNKRGSGGGIQWIVIVAIVLIVVIWLVNLAGRECSSNGDCPANSYCDYQHECNAIPVVEKTEAGVSRDTVVLLVLLSAAIGAVISYYVTSNKDKFRKMIEEKDHEKHDHDIEKDH